MLSEAGENAGRSGEEPLQARKSSSVPFCWRPRRSIEARPTDTRPPRPDCVRGAQHARRPPRGTLGPAHAPRTITPVSRHLATSLRRDRRPETKLVHRLLTTSSDSTESPGSKHKLCRQRALLSQRVLRAVGPSRKEKVTPHQSPSEVREDRCLLTHVALTPEPDDVP